MATSAQKAAFYTLTCARTLASNKIFVNISVNIYTDNRYAFRVAHDFGMLVSSSLITWLIFGEFVNSNS